MKTWDWSRLKDFSKILENVSIKKVLVILYICVIDEKKGASFFFYTRGELFPLLASKSSSCFHLLSFFDPFSLFLSECLSSRSIFLGNLFLTLWRLFPRLSTQLHVPPNFSSDAYYEFSIYLVSSVNLDFSPSIHLVPLPASSILHIPRFLFLYFTLLLFFLVADTRLYTLPFGQAVGLSVRL